MKLREFLRLVPASQEFEILNYITFRKYSWDEIGIRIDGLKVITVEAVDNVMAIYVH